MIEAHYYAYAKYDIEYRLRPNPDASLEEGYGAGAYFEVREGKEPFKGIFVAPEVLTDIATAFATAAKGIEDV